MKKFFSIFAALLFAGGLFAATEMTCAEAREAALGGSTAEVTVTGYVTKVVAAWQEKYKNVSFWMADEKDGGEVFEAFRVVCEKEADAPDVGDKVKVTGTLAVYEKDGNKTPETAAGGSFEIIEKAGGDNPPVAPGDTLSCAEAAELAVGGSTAEVIVKGYVTEIAAEWSSQYKNISFWMADTKDGGQVFQAYRVNCESEENAPKVGDLVWVKGNLKQHYEISEIAQGGSFGYVGEGGVTPPPPAGDDPTNCAEAAEAALSVSQNNELYNGGKEYTIEGFVTGIKTEWSDQYKNISFWMADAADGGEVLQAYRAACETAKDAPKVGDKVRVTGKLTKYNTTPEFAAGCTFVIVEKGQGGGGEEVAVNLSEGLRYVDCVAADGWWQIYGEDEHFFISISNVETDQAEGTYTIDDLDAEYTFLGIINGSDTAYVSFEDGSITLSIAENGDITIAGQLVGDDGNTYNINLLFVTPKPLETVNVNISEAELYDEYADYGLYAVYGEDENEVYVQLAIWTDVDFEGDFSEVDLDNQYIGSYILDGEEDAEIYKAAITVTPGNGGDYAITAEILCYNDKLYNVTMYIPGGEGIEDVNAAVKAIKTIKNGMLVIERNNHRYDATGRMVK